VGLKYYHKDFRVQFVFDEFSFPTPPEIYVNFEVDRICLLQDFRSISNGALDGFSDDCGDFLSRSPTNGTRLAIKLLRFGNSSPSSPPSFEEICYIKFYLESLFRSNLKLKTKHQLPEEIIFFGTHEAPAPNFEGAFGFPLEGGITFEDLESNWTQSKDVEMSLLNQKRLSLVNTKFFYNAEDEDEDVEELELALENVTSRIRFKHLLIGGIRR
jgi:hypothetical protein